MKLIIAGGGDCTFTEDGRRALDEIHRGEQIT